MSEQLYYFEHFHVQVTRIGRTHDVVYVSQPYSAASHAIAAKNELREYIKRGTKHNDRVEVIECSYSENTPCKIKTGWRE